MKKAVLVYDPRQMEKLLHLPDGVEIQSLNLTIEGEIHVVVCGESLPSQFNHSKGNAVRKIEPMYGIPVI